MVEPGGATAALSRTLVGLNSLLGWRNTHGRPLGFPQIGCGGRGPRLFPRPLLQRKLTAAARVTGCATFALAPTPLSPQGLVRPYLPVGEVVHPTLWGGDSAALPRRKGKLWEWRKRKVWAGTAIVVSSFLVLSCLLFDLF